MDVNSKKILWVFVMMMAGLWILGDPALAADKTEALKPYIATVDQAKEGMTFWEMIKAGGSVMVILFVLSFVTVALIVYNFLTLNENKLSPVDFVERIIQKLEEKDVVEVKEMCASYDNIVSRIIIAGLEKRKRGVILAREAMENCAKKEIGGLWQNVAYLADIATVAPLLGLLGTVLGMIQAFNAIAFQMSVVKPILLAAGVSKAMITTAGGLIVAIPTLMVYSYFRGRLQQIANTIENYNTDIIKLVTEIK